MGWIDKSQQANQKNERDKLIKKGVSPKEASKRAKEKFPLPKEQAKKKNKQPRDGGSDSGGSGGSRGRSSGSEYYGGQSSNFGKR